MSSCANQVTKRNTKTCTRYYVPVQTVPPGVYPYYLLQHEYAYVYRGRHFGSSHGYVCIGMLCGISALPTATRPSAAAGQCHASHARQRSVPPSKEEAPPPKSASEGGALRGSLSGTCCLFPGMAGGINSKNETPSAMQQRSVYGRT